MGPEQAAGVLAQVGRDDADLVRATFEAQADPYYATARLWDDGLIDPRDTRRVLALGLAAAACALLEPTAYARLPDVEDAMSGAVESAREGDVLRITLARDPSAATRSTAR